MTTNVPMPVAPPGFLDINVVWDPSVQNAPPAFFQAVAAAVHFFESFADPITVTIDIGYGVNPYDHAPVPKGDGADSVTNWAGPYTFSHLKTIQSNLQYRGGYPGAQIPRHVNLNYLPTSDPIGGNGGNFYLSTADQKSLGLISPTALVSGQPDGWIGVGTNSQLGGSATNQVIDYGLYPFSPPAANQYYEVGMLEHEISEVLGRVGSAGNIFIGQTNNFTLMDLYRIKPNGAPDPTYNSGTNDYTLGTGYGLPLNNPYAPNAPYGSNGVGSNGFPTDMADWAPSVHSDSFGNAYAGSVGIVSATDLQVMTTLGYLPPQAAGYGQTVTGATGSLTVTQGTTIKPFANVVLSDAIQMYPYTWSANIILSSYGVGGTLSGGNIVSQTNGFYALYATSLSNLQSELRSVFFTPTALGSQASATTTMALQFTDNANGATALVYPLTIVEKPPAALASQSLAVGGGTVSTSVGTNSITSGNVQNTIAMASQSRQGMEFMQTNSESDTTKVGGAGGDTFVLPLASQGFDTIIGFTELNGDLLDLRNALAATGWTGMSSALGNFLKVTDIGNDTTLSIAPSGDGRTIAIATLEGAGNLSLVDLISHNSLLT